MSTEAIALRAEGRRKAALDNLQKTLAKHVGENTAPRAQTIQVIANCLHDFSKQQLEFFESRFASDVDFKNHPLYSAAYAFDVTINQIGYDLDLLLRAAHQRNLTLPAGFEDNSKFVDTLNKADRLAMAALAPAIEHNVITRPATVLTYYQKAPTVRLIPYAPAALVGIPFSATTGNFEDLAAIPHEVGHYVFSELVESVGLLRSISDPNSPVKRKTDFSRGGIGAEAPIHTAARWLSGWAEEIFADVYACIVGGPMMGRTMLNMMRGLPATRWFEDDGKHPVPILRPRIYVTALREMATSPGVGLQTELETAANLLVAGIDEWLSGPLPAWLTFKPKTGSPIRLTMAQEELIDPLVSWLVKTKLVALLPTGSQFPLLWGDAPFGDIAANSYSDQLFNNSQSAPGDFAISQDTNNAQLSGQSYSWKIGATGLNMDWEEARTADNSALIDSLTADGWNPWWLAVLSAGFWTTEGPGPGNPQPVG